MAERSGKDDETLIARRNDNPWRAQSQSHVLQCEISVHENQLHCMIVNHHVLFWLVILWKRKRANWQLATLCSASMVTLYLHPQLLYATPARACIQIHCLVGLLAVRLLALCPTSLTCKFRSLPESCAGHLLLLLHHSFSNIAAALGPPSHRTTAATYRNPL
jgi:hypothetical protein